MSVGLVPAPGNETGAVAPVRCPLPQPIAPFTDRVRQAGRSRDNAHAHRRPLSIVSGGWEGRSIEKEKRADAVMSGDQNCINHVALVLQQIAYLTRRSNELAQETRVTAYVFADKVECVIYDKDVLRVPSLFVGDRRRGPQFLYQGKSPSADGAYDQLITNARSASEPQRSDVPRVLLAARRGGS